ncbi:MAG: DUF2334 domain-containing protein [Sphingomonas sp.]|nr:MAG: DUF2334 domain-containing protein [Sphingomonas sp.]
MAATQTERRLLLSIHDVGPRFEGQVDRLRDHLGRHAPVDRIALLVVPDHWGEARIVPGSPFAARLRCWADAGAEIFLHGWLHRDDAPHHSAVNAMRARYMTAGEGEFLGLDRVETRRRLMAGRALLEDVTGRPVRGFVAPAWLYGEGTHVALAELGFDLAEDHLRVWNPGSGTRLASGPVLTWASRSRTRIASSLLAGALLPPLLSRLTVARIGVHPGDVGVPALMTSIDRAIGRVRRTHAPARYDRLLTARAA